MKLSIGYAQALLGPLFSLALAAGAAAAPMAPAFSAKTAAAIDKAAAKHLAAGKSAGLAVAVIQNGKVVFARGYGKANLEWNTDVTADTVFRIASNTKSYTAASILLLADRGQLSLDDKLSKYVPDFPRANEVTLRELLTHTSGIASFEEAVPDQRVLMVMHTPKEMVELIEGLKPLYIFEPGSAYRYSNSGYHLLGYVVEKVSGKPLGQFMADNIFSKIGLIHTAMDDVVDLVPRRAAGYIVDPAKPGIFTNPQYIPYTTPGPAGGLRSTVTEMAQWYEALFAGKVISQQMLTQMTTPGRTKDGRLTSEVRRELSGGLQTPPPNPYEYGFGIRISNLQGHREYWHSGAVDGFNSNIRIYPDDHLTIAIASNTFRALDGFLEDVEATVLDLHEPMKIGK